VSGTLLTRAVRSFDDDADAVSFFLPARESNGPTVAAGGRVEVLEAA